jgi:heme exporter protein A
VEATATRQTEHARASIILSLNDVAVDRAGRRVVEGASFAVAAGGAVVFKGPNGSGKTTLLRAIAGLGPIAAGRIEFSVNGVVARTSSERREHAVSCGHADAVKPQMSVKENLSFWARLYGAPRARIEQALDAFDLVGLALVRAANLSAGQRRRLALCRLVISGKPIWLLDEPTSSVDEASSRRLIALIKEHLSQGGIAIVATHEKIAIETAQKFTLDARPAK